MAQQADYTFKIIMIGNSAVGKSNILLRFTRNKFEQNLRTTIGVQYVNKTILANEKRIKLQIWDTAGQQQYKQVMRTFYKGASAALLVYDITDEKSFEQLQYWYQKAKQCRNDEIIKYLVGNKSEQQDLRVISKQKGFEYAQKHKMPFYEVSAKENMNIDLVFRRVAQQLQNFMDDTILKRQVNINHAIQSKFVKEQIIQSQLKSPKKTIMPSPKPKDGIFKKITGQLKKFISERKQLQQQNISPQGYLQQKYQSEKKQAKDDKYQQLLQVNEQFIKLPVFILCQKEQIPLMLLKSSKFSKLIACEPNLQGKSEQQRKSVLRQSFILVQQNRSSIQINPQLFKAKAIPDKTLQITQSIEKDQRRQIQSTQFPYLAIGILTCKFNEINYSGTGFLIADNIVLTCAHNVYNRQGQIFFNTMYFSPGMSSRQTILKAFQSEQSQQNYCRYINTYEVLYAFVPKQYQKQVNDKNARQYDFALLFLNTNSKLGDIYGLFGLRADQIDLQRKVQIFGFPQDRNFDRNKSQYISTLFGCQNLIKELRENIILHTVDTSAGQSGSPIFQREKKNFQEGQEIYVIGIHIGAYSIKKQNVGVKINQSVLQRLNKWILNFLQIDKTNNKASVECIELNVTHKIDLFEAKMCLYQKYVERQELLSNKMQVAMRTQRQRVSQQISILQCLGKKEDKEMRKITFDKPNLKKIKNKQNQKNKASDFWKQLFFFVASFYKKDSDLDYFKRAKANIFEKPTHYSKKLAQRLNRIKVSQQKHLEIFNFTKIQQLIIEEWNDSNVLYSLNYLWFQSMMENYFKNENLHTQQDLQRHIETHKRFITRITEAMFLHSVSFYGNYGHGDNFMDRIFEVTSMIVLTNHIKWEQLFQKIFKRLYAQLSLNLKMKPIQYSKEFLKEIKNKIPSCLIRLNENGLVDLQIQFGYLETVKILKQFSDQGRICSKILLFNKLQETFYKQIAQKKAQIEEKLQASDMDTHLTIMVLCIVASRIPDLYSSLILLKQYFSQKQFKRNRLEDWTNGGQSFLLIILASVEYIRQVLSKFDKYLQF